MKTIRDGERAIFWKHDGSHRLLDGPKIVWQPFANLQPLEKFQAACDEFLVIRFQDGRVEHRPGPAVEFLDPVEMISIELQPAVSLDAHEALVIYKSGADNTVERRVLGGPALHFPDADEWLHEFRWHGSNSNGPGCAKRPRALQFTKLRVIPDQMYFDIDEVRTSDEALLTVKVMLFFELADIGRMLDQTHDPIADFINALTADVINFAAAGKFEDFKSHTELLNALETYPQLVARAERIGYRINKVVYRGYHASDKLQAMHDSAIEARTQLVLEGETEEQVQTLEDLKLEREIAREQTRRGEEVARAEHQRALERAEHEEGLRRDEEVEAQALEHLEKRRSAELEFARGRDELRLAFLGGLREFDADLTEVLVAENRNPDRVIELRGSADPSVLLQESA